MDIYNSKYKNQNCKSDGLVQFIKVERKKWNKVSNDIIHNITIFVNERIRLFFNRLKESDSFNQVKKYGIRQGEKSKHNYNKPDFILWDDIFYFINVI